MTATEDAVVAQTAKELKELKVRHKALLAEDEAWKKQYDPKATPEYKALQEQYNAAAGEATKLGKKLEAKENYIIDKYLTCHRGDDYLRYERPEYVKSESYDRKSNIRFEVVCAIQRHLKTSYLRESDINTIVGNMIAMEKSSDPKYSELSTMYGKAHRKADVLRDNMWKMERDVPKSPVDHERYLVWRRIGELEHMLANPAKVVKRSKEAEEREKAQDLRVTREILDDIKATEQERNRIQQESECAAEARAESRMFERE